jgi:hypothetical protein
MHIAIRDFSIEGDDRHCFGWGEVRYTYTVKPSRPARLSPGGFHPSEGPEIDVTEIAICLHGSKGWTPVDGMLWDLLREVPDAWFLEQIEEDAE